MLIVAVLPLQLEAVGQKLPESTFSYSHTQCILYALGVGMSTKDDHHLKFLYEGHEDFSCLPTFGVIPSQAAMMDGGLGSVPGLNFDFTRVKAPGNNPNHLYFCKYSRIDSLYALYRK